MPNILVTNDDGIEAPGLRALVAALEGLGTVYVVAPHRERSAAAQSITIHEPIFFQSTGEREWAVQGTPADAVILALNRLLPEPPALVLSGINYGANLGENVYYSGTVAAAQEGAINGIPSCALSLAARRKGADFTAAADFSRRLAAVALEEGLPRGVLLSANIPQDWNGGVRFTRQSKKITRNVLREDVDPRGRPFVWLCEQKAIDEVEPDTDYAAVFAGCVSITPLELDRTHSTSLNHLSHWAARLARV